MVSIVVLLTLFESETVKSENTRAPSGLKYHGVPSTVAPTINEPVLVACKVVVAVMTSELEAVLLNKRVEGVVEAILVREFIVVVVERERV